MVFDNEFRFRKNSDFVLHFNGTPVLLFREDLEDRPMVQDQPRFTVEGGGTPCPAWEIRELGTKRQHFDQQSPEYWTLTSQLRELQARLKAGAPALTSPSASRKDASGAVPPQ